MREIYVVRHAESEANVEPRFDSTPPGAPLTALGALQARRLADLLAAWDLAPTVVHASPFRRTQETASAFAARIGARIETQGALREVEVGAWDGHGPAHLSADPVYQRWRTEPEIAPPGGESLEAVLARTLTLISSLCAESPPAQPLVLFTHQHTLRSLLWHLGRLRDADGRLLGLPNASVLHLTSQNGGDELRLCKIDRTVHAATEDDRSAAI